MRKYNHLFITRLATLIFIWFFPSIAFSSSSNSVFDKNAFFQDSLVSSSYIIENGNLLAEFSNDGQLTKITDVESGASFTLKEYTQIDGLFAYKTKILQTDSLQLRMTQIMRDTMGNRACTLIKTFHLKNQVLEVNVAVIGEVYDFATPINTIVIWEKNKNTTYWTAWGRENSSETRLNLDGNMNPKSKEHFDSWEDPLTPAPFENLQLSYGGKRADKYVKAFSLPLFSILQSEKNKSFNLVYSPKDTIIKLAQETTIDGRVKFSRLNDRIGTKNTINYSYDIFLAEDDWRPVLRYVTEKYKNYFLPPNNRVSEFSGTASYSGHNATMDVKKYKDMAYAFNWYAIRNWPYLGMFLPPVEKGASWQSWSGYGSGTATTGRTVSFDTIRRNHKLMQKRGFHLLEYFNLNEFGYRIKFPFHDSSIDSGEPLWKQSNNLLHKKMYPAMLYREDDRARFSWNRSVIMDPAHDIYHTYLMDQAKRMIVNVPEFSGYGIDRLDWFEYFNYRADDGLAMINGKKVSAMSNSLHKIMRPLSKLLHKNDKVIFYNPHLTRLDFAQYFDGIFDEFADKGNKINLSALLAMQKPIVGWLHNQDVIQANPDRWMQKYLYLGVYPMAPYTQANHSLETSAWADELYRDYGLIFKALKGKKWVLEPHVAKVRNGSAKINVFKTDSGVLVPIVLSDETGQVGITLRLGKLFPKGNYRAYITYPGSRKWQRYAVDKKNPDYINVDLKRGAAILKFTK